MEFILIIVAFILSFSIVLITVPPILRVAREKHIFESFEERKIHKSNIPTFGGVAIFLGFILSSIIATDGLSFPSLKFIIAAVIIVFFTGLKDDLVNISAKKKLAIQIIAALIIITFGNIRFTDLHGVMGVHELNYVSSVILSLFAIVVITNAFNLIDGIDGLASGLAMLGATVFGVWFYIAGYYQFSIVSFALLGSLAAFFLYNVFGNTNKLFMGDTGSLIIGIVMSVLVIEFNQFNISKHISYAIGAAPSVSFAVIIVPLIDTLRVMSIRISNKKSPFTADNNHIHHRLLALTSSHFKVTLIIIAANIIIIALAILLNHISINHNIQLLIIFITGILFSFLPALILRLKKNFSIKTSAS